MHLKSIAGHFPALIFCLSFCFQAAAQDDVYRSFRVHIAPYSPDVSVVTGAGWRGEEYDTVVSLRLVTAGKLSLYVYRDPSDVPYFFIQAGNGAPQQLRIRNRVIAKNGGQAKDVVTDDLYRDQLADWVGNCPAIMRPVKIAYEENALRQLIDTYNHCGVGIDVAHRRRKQGVRLSFSLMAGYRYSPVSIDAVQGVDVSHTHFPASNGPVGGIGVAVQRPGSDFALTVDGLFTPFSSSSNKWQKDYYESVTGKLDFDVVTADVQIRYTYPLEKWKPFISAGVANSFIINDNSWQNTFDAASGKSIREGFLEDQGGLRTYRPGFVGGIGVSRGPWGVEARYEVGQGLAESTHVHLRASSWSVLVSFRL